jgi:hypothetical protein
MIKEIAAPLKPCTAAVLVELIPQILAVPSPERFYFRRLAKTFGFD